MPPQMRTNVSVSRRAPWTRRTALALWSRCIGTLSLVATGAIALGTASQGIEAEVRSTLLGLGLVLALPILWIALTRVAERRHLARPPKGFLAAALGLGVGGIALVAAAVALPLSEQSQAPIFTAGGVLEALGTALLLVWYAAIRVVAPDTDHMHAL